ncbi:patched domain-containing protein 3-like [Centruroides sculpturatus]|uniref:patched domain-containing protein 3-like n=1 Tax=Centruroides sculpturatus TaxID=218467 RepID=UPI000C6E3248|nr:patched domain-containing protein 3-like [Centruroides sculpturatus]XP_023209848.1 patched domain-containing protein 3-like [Centruroides sculpturatus]
MKFNYIQRILSSFYYRLGRQISQKPAYFFAFPIIITAILSFGFLRIKLERDPTILYSVQHGRAMTEMRNLQKLFPMNYSSNFDIIRAISTENSIHVMFTASDGGNMIKKDIFYRILTLDEQIRNMEVTLNHSTFKYEDICATNEGQCLRNTLKELEPLITGKNSKLKYPINFDPFTFVFQPFVINLGGVNTDDNGIITDIRAMRLVYVLNGDVDKQLISETWQNTLLEQLKKNISDELVLYVFVPSSVEKELEEFSSNMLPFTGIVAVVIMIFSSISCMSSDWIRSKPLLGIFACVSAILAIVAAFGFAMLCGLTYVDINIALPFLILGMEVDDAYVLIAAWRLTKTEWSVSKRMAECYSEAAVSVTITSITNLLAFCIGVLSPYKAMQIFCSYAAICIFFTFVYLIFFFGSVIAMSGYREHLNLHPLLCIKVDKRISMEDEELETVEEDYIMTIFRDKLGGLLRYNSVKIIIIAVFITVLGFGIWGFKFLREGMELADAFSSDSDLALAIKIYYKYFTRYPYILHVAINKTMNFADLGVQQQVNELLEEFEDHPFISGVENRISWLKFFNLFQLSPFSKIVLNGYDLSDKREFVDSLNEVFLNIPLARQFKQDINFNENLTEITSTRFLLLCENVNDISEEKKLLQDVWNIADSSPLPLIVHSIFFPGFEQSVLIRSIVIQTGWATVILIAAIFFLFIPNVKCAVCVSIAVISTLIETVGYMALWGVKLDLMSMIILLLGIGLSINYPAHTTFAFRMSKHRNSNDKMKSALYAVGMPIVQGSLSTVIGVSVLLYSSSYMLIICFKIVLLVIVSTAFHSLLVIPVIMSVIEKYSLSHLPDVSDVRRISRVSFKIKNTPEEEVQMCVDSEDKSFSLKSIFIKGYKNDDMVFVNNTLL